MKTMSEEGNMLSPTLPIKGKCVIKGILRRATGKGAVHKYFVQAGLAIARLCFWLA